jgi:hypothetical protein
MSRPSKRLARLWAQFQAAGEVGAVDPELWAEAEGGLMVLDKAHPSYDCGSLKGDVGQDSVVLNLGGKISGGAW